MGADRTDVCYIRELHLRSEPEDTWLNLVEFPLLLVIPAYYGVPCIAT